MGIIDRLDKRFSLRDACLGVNMNDMEQAVNKAIRGGGSPFPPALASNVLAWWDAGYQKDVVLGLNQLVTNGNLANGTTGWVGNSRVSISAASNTLSITGNGSHQTPYATMNNINSVDGRKYYMRVSVRVTNALCTSLFTQGDFVFSISNPTENTWYDRTVVLTTNDSSIGFQIYHSYADAATANGKTAEVKMVMLFDASTDFGTGNEPTAAEFTAILAADGNQYWEGSRNVICNPGGKYYAYDASGNGRPAKLYNMAYTAASGPQAGPPKHWKGDGVDDWMGRAESGFIAQDADFSYVCVFSPFSDNAICRLGYALLTDFSTNPAFSLSWIGGEFEARVYDRVSGSVATYNTRAILASTWYSVVVTYSSSDKKARLYFGGNLVTTSSALANGHPAISFTRHYRDLAGTAYTKQSLGLSGYANKALSAQEVKDIHNKLASRFGLTPVA